MSDNAMRVEFALPPTVGPTATTVAPGERAVRQRQERAARTARSLALAYWIDELIRSGKVADLAAVARMCGVSRARVSTMMGCLGWSTVMQDQALQAEDRQ